MEIATLFKVVFPPQPRLILNSLYKLLIFLPLFCLILGGTVQAQDQTSLSEETAQLLKLVNLKTVDGREMAEVSLKLVLQLALERSLLLQASKLGNAAAQLSVIAAQERNKPSVTTSFGYAKILSLTASSSCSPSQLCGSSTNSMTFSSAYTQKTDSGLTYGLTYSEQTKKSTSLSLMEMGGEVTTGTTGDSLSSLSLTSSVSIPFFQDSGTEYNNIPVRLAEINVTRGQLNSQQAELSLLKQVASIYWDLVGILETVEVKKKAVNLSEKLLRDNQARLEAGLLSSTEVRVTETQLMRNRQSLLSSRLDALRIEDQVRAALNLKNLPVGLYPVDRPATNAAVTENVSALLEKIYANDTQIGLKQASLEQNRYQLEQELNKQKTNLDLNLSYVLNGYSKNSFGGIADFSKSDLHGMNVTLTWKVPLGDQATIENIQRKRLEQQQITLQIKDRKSQLDVSVQSLLRSLSLIEKEKMTAAAVSKLSKDQLRNEIKRFKLGKSTSYRISQNQQDVVESEQQEILIRIRQEKIRVELLALTGEFNEKYELNQK
ncbi:MAG TPA: TolC family protein [Candidatus Lambdaproteobacteria bacterium]|nr:TolC family protein [Candidatus Lambdaproteobacteria bacterium]HIO84444.1 TolC family protein [Deltaproteobacteria bacterium]